MVRDQKSTVQLLYSNQLVNLSKGYLDPIYRILHANHFKAHNVNVTNAANDAFGDNRGILRQLRQIVQFSTREANKAWYYLSWPNFIISMKEYHAVNTTLSSFIEILFMSLCCTTI